MLHKPPLLAGEVARSAGGVMADQILTRILFTSVGRRVELVKAFQKAGQKNKIPVWIIGADLQMDAPALFFCDEAVKVCRIDDEDYIPQLIKICQEKNVDLVIPTIDTDLYKLSEAKEKFETVGTKVLISAPEAIKICRDKRKTARFFEECGLNTPVTVDKVEDFKGEFPRFIKPLDGSSSVNAFRAEDKEELDTFAEVIGEGKYIIQQYIKGLEITVDILCSISQSDKGCPILITPRKRLAVRSGEVLKTEIFMDETIIDEARIIVEKLKPTGSITVQLIREETTGNDYFIEINPRFGGGAPLSMKAGADMAGEVLRELKCANRTRGNQEEEKAVRNSLEGKNGVKNGLIFSRFDDSICINTREYTCPCLKTGEEVSEYIKGLVSRGEVKAVVFDMDDTLYSEREYIESGFKAVADELFRLTKEIGSSTLEADLYTFMLEAFEEGKRAIDLAIEKCGFGDEETKKKIISLYRNHTPKLTLYPWADELISWLCAEGGLSKDMLGIITDGSPNGQHRKLTALGLDDRVGHIIVTDELGGAQFRKPCDIAYRVMALRMQETYENIIYIGNNPTKDLKAPRELGMKTLFFDNPDCVHVFDRKKI